MPLNLKQHDRDKVESDLPMTIKVNDETMNRFGMTASLYDVATEISKQFENVPGFIGVSIESMDVKVLLGKRYEGR
jgi:hypothetical protein